MMRVIRFMFGMVLMPVIMAVAVAITVRDLWRRSAR